MKLRWWRQYAWVIPIHSLPTQKLKSRFTILKFKSSVAISVLFSMIFKAVLFGPYDMGHIILYGSDDLYGSIQIVLRNDTHILQ